MGAMMLSELAAPAAVSPDAWKSVIDAMASQLSVSTVVGVLTSIIGASIGLVFLWWGVRKAAKALMRAFKSGKLKL